MEDTTQTWKHIDDEKGIEMLNKFTTMNKDIEKLNELIPENPIDLIKIEFIVGEDETDMDFYDFIIHTIQTSYNHGYKKAIADGMTTVIYNMERKKDD